MIEQDPFELKVEFEKEPLKLRPPPRKPPFPLSLDGANLLPPLVGWCIDADWKGIMAIDVLDLSINGIRIIDFSSASRSTSSSKRKSVVSRVRMDVRKTLN